jgi:hypothetical protein
MLAALDLVIFCMTVEQVYRTLTGMLAALGLVIICMIVEYGDAEDA